MSHKAISGGFWALAEKLSSQFVTFIVTVVLARLLTPSDYGTVALLAIFVSVAEVIADSGFGKALVQKKDAEDIDFNSVFYCSLAVSFLVYFILFITAPWIAKIYNQPELAGLLRVISIVIIFHTVNSVQDAELTRKLLFCRSFKISIIVTIASAVTGIALALYGYGAWALVWSQVVAGLVGCIARWFIIAWRPRLMFSRKSLYKLFSYGWKMTASSIVARLYSKMYGLLIGKFYTCADLAFVDRARYLPGPLIDAIDGTLRRVTFPVLAKAQDDKVLFREIMRRMMQLSLFLILPLMAGCAICAESIVMIIYGEQWLPVVPYLRIMCFVFALYPLHTINLQAIAAVGRSDIFLKLEIIKKIIGIAFLFITIRYGVLVMLCVSAFMIGPVGVIINSWPNRKLLDYSVIQQVKDIFPCLIACGVMAIVCFIEGWLLAPCSFGSNIILVVLQVITGAGIYYLVSALLRISALDELKRIAYIKLTGIRRKRTK